MNLGFWKNLKKPIIVLAPMADVTDVAFRRVIAKYGKPDVMWTEFVSADGIVRAPNDNHQKSKAGLSSKQILLKDLEYSEEERPIVAQLFSSNPEYMEQASKLVQEIGFDGIDINMGCPDKTIEKQGCGAAMIKKENRENTKVIIEAVKRGAPNLPVSVKTRIGYNKPVDSAQGKEDFEDWMTFLLEQDIACLTIHFRTRKEMSKVSAHWELAKKAVELRDKISPETILLGNGDVKDLEDAYKKIKETGIDGVMIGRGIFGNPWFFANLADLKGRSQFERPAKVRRTKADLSVDEVLEVMLEHTKLFEELLPHKSFSVMKKHYKAYLTPVASAKGVVDGFDGAKELRGELMGTENSKEVEKIVKDFLKTHTI